MYSIDEKLRMFEQEESSFATRLEDFPKDRFRELRDQEYHWVKPELVAEIEFLSWSNRFVRHASFKRIREDKEAEEIVIEKEGENDNSS